MEECHKALVKGDQQRLPEGMSESSGWTHRSCMDGKRAFLVMGTAKTKAESATSNTMVLG